MLYVRKVKYVYVYINQSIAYFYHTYEGMCVIMCFCEYVCVFVVCTVRASSCICGLKIFEHVKCLCRFSVSSRTHRRLAERGNFLVYNLPITVVISCCRKEYSRRSESSCRSSHWENWLYVRWGQWVVLWLYYKPVLWPSRFCLGVTVTFPLNSCWPFLFSLQTSQLYYNSDTGTYYCYDLETHSYQVHSQVPPGENCYVSASVSLPGYVVCPVVVVEAWLPSIRAIVTESESVDVGTLAMVTVDGGTIGRLSFSETEIRLIATYFNVSVVETRGVVTVWKSLKWQLVRWRWWLVDAASSVALKRMFWVVTCRDSVWRRDKVIQCERPGKSEWNVCE